MEALQFDPQKKSLTLIKTNLPTVVDKTDVVVKIAYAGICGTDLHILEGSFPCRDAPFIPGHEFCGVVSSIGSEVNHIKQGDRVVIDPNRGCSTCLFCSSGRYQLCHKESINNTIGIFSNGGWAQFCKAPASQVYRISDAVSFQQAVLTEPLSCVCHGWDRIGSVPFGSQVLVVGAGIIGNLWTSLLHHVGHRNVFVSEPNPARRALNEKLETGFRCCSLEELQSMKAANPLWGADFCVDCSGNGPAMQSSIELLNRGGTLCIFGVASPSTRISLSPFDVFYKEIAVVGVLINHFTFPKAIALIEAMGSRYLDFEKLGIKVFSLDQYKEALLALKKGSISKAVFQLVSD